MKKITKKPIGKATKNSKNTKATKNSFGQKKNNKELNKSFKKDTNSFKKNAKDAKIEKKKKIAKIKKASKEAKKNASNDNNKIATFNWYPGHMTKAKRQMQEDIKLIDLVIEIVDARVPLSSRNPDIDDLADNKARVVILNKSDLADDKITNLWITYFKSKGFYCVKMDSRKNNGFKALNEIIYEACEDKIQKDLAKGIKNRPIRAMVVGIPNVGKSTFVNAYSGKASAKTGNKPGVTKGKQWIKIKGNIELLDTPGILWPKFEDQTTGLRLAMIGSINDNILNKSDLALDVIKFLYKNYKDNLYARYEITTNEFAPSDNDLIDEQTQIALLIMDHIAAKRGCLKKGAQTDYDKVSGIILDDFRSAKLGCVTLERP